MKRKVDLKKHKFILPVCTAVVIVLLMAAMAYIIKLIVDCIAIIPYLKTINKRNLLYYMPLMSIFYPFYVTFTGIVSVISFVIKNNKTTKIRMGK